MNVVEVRHWNGIIGIKTLCSILFHSQLNCFEFNSEAVGVTEKMVTTELDHASSSAPLIVLLENIHMMGMRDPIHQGTCVHVVSLGPFLLTQWLCAHVQPAVSSLVGAFLLTQWLCAHVQPAVSSLVGAFLLTQWLCVHVQPAVSSLVGALPTDSMAVCMQSVVSLGPFLLTQWLCV